MYYYNKPAYDYTMPVMDYSQLYRNGRSQDQMDYMPETSAAVQDAQRNMQTYQSEVLNIIQNAVKGEKEDRDFYEQLIELSTSQEDKEIISEIRNNEIKHNRMFKQLYYELTGQRINAGNDMSSDERVTISTYCEGLKKALMGEQKAVEKYRKILFSMNERKHINMMTEIITDELRHLGLYNYLYSKNHCSV